MTQKLPSMFAVVLTLSLLAWPFGPTEAGGGKSGKLEGTWLTELDAGLPGVPPIIAYFTFNKGGTFTQSQTLVHANSVAIDPICGCTASIGHGIWRKIGRNKYEYEFRGLIFAGPDSASFNLNLSAQIFNEGQHIGYGIARGSIRVRGDAFEGVNDGSVVNLEGETLNPDFDFMEFAFAGERLGFE